MLIKINNNFRLPNDPKDFGNFLRDTYNYKKGAATNARDLLKGFKSSLNNSTKSVPSALQSFGKKNIEK